jgi:hypothetical protein
VGKHWENLTKNIQYFCLNTIEIKTKPDLTELGELMQDPWCHEKLEETRQVIENKCWEEETCLRISKEEKYWEQVKMTKRLREVMADKDNFSAIKLTNNFHI